MSNFITPGDNSAFETLKVLDGKKVLYFTASWCPPCKVIGPIVEKMAKSNPDITFVKIDIDELPEAAAYGKWKTGRV
jgi:thiol-disulfide isomerase/thioredoxin